ncbi:MAG: hypothetical protein LBU03_04910 [Tannerellaceae bacterium]|nr:hypothetical protein [Tannerellaceae bacterium]
MQPIVYEWRRRSIRLLVVCLGGIVFLFGEPEEWEKWGTMVSLGAVVTIIFGLLGYLTAK